MEQLFVVVWTGFRAGSTHPWPPPGQPQRGLPPVEEGLGGGGEQGVLEEGAAVQAGPPQLVEVLTLKAANPFGHHGGGGCRREMGTWMGYKMYGTVILFIYTSVMAKKKRCILKLIIMGVAK